MAVIMKNADGSTTMYRDMGSDAGKTSYSAPNKTASQASVVSSKSGVVAQIENNESYIRSIIKNSFAHVSSYVQEGKKIVDQQSIETNFDQAMHNHFDILVKGMEALGEKTTLLCDILDDYAKEQSRLDSQNM